MFNLTIQKVPYVSKIEVSSLLSNLKPTCHNLKLLCANLWKQRLSIIFDLFKQK